MTGKNPAKAEGSRGLIAEMVAQFTDVKAFLAALPASARLFHIFYLLGPVFLLIERSPADFWLSMCGLVFFVRCIVLRDWKWLRHFWVRACFAFWGVCLLSSAISSIPIYSLGEAFVWIRFPLFAFASCFWLAKSRQMIVAMMGMIALGMILMTGILTLEILIVENYTGRMTWPYGDKVPGNYLSKAALPAFCVLVAIAVSNRKPFNGIAALISFITIIMSVVTGERINFLLRACSGMLAGIAWKPKFSRMAALILLEVSAIFAVFLVAPNIGYRFIDKFIYQLPTHQESPYYKVMNGGLESFEQAPVFGIGTGNYRILCPDIMEEKAHGACHPHPHNYYIQILAETGIVGFLFGCLMIGSILWRAAKISLKGREKVIASIAFIVPLAFFFPLQSTADFFGQWNNIFMWSSIGFVLASGNLLES